MKLSIDNSKRKYKALILDVDGTTIPNKKDGMPSPKVVSSLAKAAKYIHICLATSRPYKDLAHILDRLNLSGYSIINGGSQIIDMKSRSFLWEQPILRKDVQAVIDILSKENVARVWLNDGKSDITIPTISLPKIIFQIYIGVNFTIFEADNLIAKLSHISTISAHKVPSWTKGFFCIIITHALATKQHGIFEIAKLLEIKTHDIIGIGDGYNDFPLLMACGLKIAMGNAVPELKEIADYIAPSVEKDGLVDVINKFILNV